VNVPVGIMGLFATAVIQREYKTERARSFDVIGFISMATFLCALLLALTDGNAAWNTGGWTSPFIISCFMIAALSLTIFFITELTVEHPLIDLSLFKDFNFSIANGILFIFGFGMFGSTFLLPLYLQLSLGYTAFQAGSLFLPVGILQAITAPISGYLSDKSIREFQRASVSRSLPGVCLSTVRCPCIQNINRLCLHYTFADLPWD